MIAVVDAGTRDDVFDREQSAMFQAYPDIVCGGFLDVGLVRLPDPFAFGIVGCARLAADTEAVSGNQAAVRATHLADECGLIGCGIGDIKNTLLDRFGDASDHHVSENREQPLALFDLANLDFPVGDVADFDQRPTGEVVPAVTDADGDVG